MLQIHCIFAFHIYLQYKNFIMIKKLLFSALLTIIMLDNSMVNAQERTVLSAQIYGYKGDMIYFDCVQTPLIRQEFYTNPGEEHLFAFDTDAMVCMLINGRTKVLMLPGDSVHVDIHYNGRNIESIDFSGSAETAKANKLLAGIDDIKRDMRYKSQLLACAVVDVKPKERLDASKVLLDKVSSMLSENGINESMANYIMAGIESEAYISMMEYPVMYASMRGVSVDKQDIGDYWSLMDGITIRNDYSSLSNPDYSGMLMRYCFYQNEKTAKEKGNTYRMPDKLEDMYSELAAFYTAEQRDAVLYNLLCNYIKNGQEIERADALYKEYISNYNKNERFKQVLDAILQ